MGKNKKKSQRENKTRELNVRLTTPVHIKSNLVLNSMSVGYVLFMYPYERITPVMLLKQKHVQTNTILDGVINMADVYRRTELEFKHALVMV